MGAFVCHRPLLGLTPAVPSGLSPPGTPFLTPPPLPPTLRRRLFQARRRRDEGDDDRAETESAASKRARDEAVSAVPRDRLALGPPGEDDMEV